MNKFTIMRRMERIGMKWEHLLYVLGIDELEINDVLETIKQCARKKNVPQTAMQLHQLPLEILIQTTSYLDLADAVKLSSCSKQFLSLRRFVFGNRRKLVLTSPVESIPQFIKDHTQCVDINAKCIDHPCDEGMFKLHFKLLETFTDIRQLDNTYEGCFDLDLLPEFTDIQQLHLNTCGIKDLSAISRFKLLKEVNISKRVNEFFTPDMDYYPLDIFGLSNLSDLRTLSIRCGIVSNIAALSTMNRLEHLELDEMNITDISYLSPLVNLVHLILYGNTITDIKALENMKKLKTLVLTTEKPLFLDTYPLVHFAKLEALELSGYQLSDISFASSLPCLTMLSLEDSNISDLKPLQSLKNLEYLYLSDNQIKNVSVLSHFIKLKELNLDGNDIEDISCFQHLVKLTSLSLDDNSVVDISSLAGMERLETLNVSGNQVEDCHALAGLLGLSELHLANNRIKCVAPLKTSRKLHTLHLSENYITDVTPLSMLVELKELYLCGNSISKIIPLSGLIKLRKLDLGSNGLRDITPLYTLTNLTYVRISFNEIHSIWPLIYLPNLERLLFEGIDEEEMGVVLQTIEQLALKKNSSDNLMHIYKIPLEILIKTTSYLDSTEAVKLSSCSKEFLTHRKFIFGTRINASDDENTLKLHYKMLETFSDIRQIDIDYKQRFDMELLSQFTH
ncbi:hypothetical protein HDV02_004427, partial [Globomyces sp. JEL0801]